MCVRACGILLFERHNFIRCERNSLYKYFLRLFLCSVCVCVFGLYFVCCVSVCRFMSLIFFIHGNYTQCILDLSNTNTQTARGWERARGKWNWEKWFPEESMWSQFTLNLNAFVFGWCIWSQEICFRHPISLHISHNNFLYNFLLCYLIAKCRKPIDTEMLILNCAKRRAKGTRMGLTDSNSLSLSIAIHATGK